jgi:hypothetical protein
MTGWSEDHMVAICSLKLSFDLVGGIWFNWSSDRALRWKVKTVGWEDRGVIYGKSIHLRLLPPLMSVNDRWVGPREKVLNVPIACWYMGPVSLVACWWQLCGFLHCFYGYEGERNWMGTRRSVSRRAGDVVRNSFFSGAVTLSNSVNDFAKDCYMWTTWDTYDRGLYVDWAWKSCGVLVGFSPIGCISIRITATLGYE